MSKSISKRHSGVLGKTLLLEDFEVLAGKLKRWRAPEIQKLELEKGSGLVLGFVKGLKLSAGLIYAIRKRISTHDLEVHWGHLLNPGEDSCSPECDVIIHKKGFFYEWNGDGQADRVMDFKFIKSEDAIAVISCKSHAKSIDRNYPTKLKPYVKTVLLFAECCPPRQYGRLRCQARDAGYRDFWCLYTYDDSSGICDTQPKHWQEFMDTVCNIIAKASSRKK
jgi:hypothetical protein